MSALPGRLVIACAAILAIASARAELVYTSTGNSIARFDTSTPTTVASVGITGLQPGESIIGIDRRPANGLIYGIGSTNRLYTLDPISGAATHVGAAGGFGLNGNNFGIDFNPIPDRLRLVSDNEQNIRINPNDGTLAGTDASLNPAGSIVAAAYTNNFAGATQTTLYGIDYASGNLVLIGSPNGTPNSPNSGIVTVVGSLGLGMNLLPQIGFDISGTSGIAYAVISLVVAQGRSLLDGVTITQTQLYTINLNSGTATLVGTVGNGFTLYSGFTAATAIPEPSSGMLIGAAMLLLALVHRGRRAPGPDA